MADRFALGVLDDVRVDVHGDADLAVTKDLHDDAGRNPGGDKDRGAAVPGIVQPDDAEAGRVGDAGEGIAMGLDEEPYRQAKRWLKDELPHALQAIRQGRELTLTLNHRTTRIQWTARPAIFLPRPTAKPGNYPNAPSSSPPPHTTRPGE